MINRPGMIWLTIIVLLKAAHISHSSHVGEVAASLYLHCSGGRVASNLSYTVADTNWLSVAATSQHGHYVLWEQPSYLC